jgi:NADH-quinone oxidoreductase subunit C
MSDTRFQAPTAAASIAAKNAAVYTRQREALETGTLKNLFIRAEWPGEPTDIGKPHASTPLQKDGVTSFQTDMPTLMVLKENFLQAVAYLRKDEAFQYDFLLDLTAVDYLNSPRSEDRVANQNKRFQVVYLFRSMETVRSATLRLVVPVDEGEEVPSLTSVWAGADWPEREVFDLMGIRFSDHPNLRRIVLPDNYRGHPLRKDFPVKGIGEDYLIEDLLYKRRNED